MSEHLVLCAHGTDSPTGQATVRAITESVTARMASIPTMRHIEVRDAYVDVQSPSIDDVMAHLAGQPTVVVPLLLCTGYHVQVDIARAVERHGCATATRALGPHAALTQRLSSLLLQAGAVPGEPVILAAAGSSRPEATADARAAADLLKQAWGGTVTSAFGSAAQPRVSDAVAAAHADGRRAVVASYLLGHGYFHDLLKSCGAEVVTEPLGADPLVVDAVLARYTETEGSAGSQNLHG